MTKNDIYLQTKIFCYSPVLSCTEGGVDGRSNTIFQHIFTNIYSKISTGFISPSVLLFCKLLLYFILVTYKFE